MRNERDPWAITLMAGRARIEEESAGEERGKGREQERVGIRAERFERPSLAS